MSIISPFFNRFLSHYICDDVHVWTCQVDIYFTIKKVQLVIKHWTFNTRDRIMSIEQRQTFCKKKEEGNVACCQTAFFKRLLTETNHEWQKAKIILSHSSSSDWWSVWTIHIQMHVTEVRMSSSDYSLSQRRNKFDHSKGNRRIRLFISLSIRLNKEINPSVIWISTIVEYAPLSSNQIFERFAFQSNMDDASKCFHIEHDS